jgi:inosine/xanthosine triphosphatase
VQIVVASTNPVKMHAVSAGFERMFPSVSYDLIQVGVPSGVSDQPMTDEETLLGALGRAKAASGVYPLADYWVGVEGGIQAEAGEMLAFAWVAILSPQLVGKGRTGSFILPSRVTALIHEGNELGEADDIVFGRTNSKQENGAVGLLTGDVINRAQLYEQAVILALIPFKNPALYTPG